MRDVLFVTSFRYLEIEQRIERHVELMPGINITNDEEVIEKLLTPGLLDGIGHIEYDYLRQAPNVVFYEYKWDDLIKLGVNEEADKLERFLVAVLIWIENLFGSAWLMKDHAMECDAAFLYINENSRDARWSSNYLASKPSFANGASRKLITMSLADLKVWNQINDHVESYLFEKQSSSIRFMMAKSFSRTGRAMQFITNARHARNLPFKVAHYCSALETLFTTDASELAHKLSERIAFFLGNQGHNRSVVFKNIKQAYEVRSKLTHGDTLDAKRIEALPLVSQTIDVYLREIMNTIFSDDSLRGVFDSHNQQIEDYFHKLIFGAG